MAPSSSGQGPGISATIPQGGETGLPTDQVVSVFFTERDERHHPQHDDRLIENVHRLGKYQRGTG